VKKTSEWSLSSRHLITQIRSPPVPVMEDFPSSRRACTRECTRSRIWSPSALPDVFSPSPISSSNPASQPSLLRSEWKLSPTPPPDPYIRRSACFRVRLASHELCWCRIERERFATKQPRKLLLLRHPTAELVRSYALPNMRMRRSRFRSFVRSGGGVNET
jgi:hypothetical protein